MRKVERIIISSLTVSRDELLTKSRALSEVLDSVARLEYAPRLEGAQECQSAAATFGLCVESELLMELLDARVRRERPHRYANNVDFLQRRIHLCQLLAYRPTHTLSVKRSAKLLEFEEGEN